MPEKKLCRDCEQPMRLIYGGSEMKGTRWREFRCKCGYHCAAERLHVHSVSPYTATWQKVRAFNANPA